MHTACSYGPPNDAVKITRVTHEKLLHERNGAAREKRTAQSPFGC
jgi:hypothetical protein